MSDQETKTLLLQYLNEIIIFGGLDSNEIELIESISSVKEFKENEVILTENEIGDQFYILCEGFVTVTKNTDSKETYISTISPFSHFGESALFHDCKRIATVKGQTNGKYISIKKDDFTYFVKEYPATANKVLYKMLQVLFKRLESTNVEATSQSDNGLNQETIDKMLI